ncbi:MAG TPA: hypothetical protein VK745_15595 [Polyangiaceae bacterium]|nr:hypothetical protein [Polyangiaceae bacterium]
MKNRRLMIALVAAMASVAAAASAQPRHPGDRPDDRRAHDEHHDAVVEHHDAVMEHHDAVVEHHDAVVERRESEDEVRIRLLRRQEEEHARRQAERRDERAWDARREQRALDARNELLSTWGPALDRGEARSELSIHADRMARLNRILDVAEDRADAALIARTQAVIQREIARDARVLHRIRASMEAQ